MVDMVDGHLARLQSGARLRVVVAYGTRPEAVKLAPLIRELCDDGRFEPFVAVTGQHRDMLDQVNQVFGIVPDVDLDIHRPGHTLSGITTRCLDGVERVLHDVRPDALVVQGDTTTTMAAAMAGFYARVPVVHVEAGLRTNDPGSPFPEEINRRLATQLASLHLAPTRSSRANLLAEGISPDVVHVTGNTVIDALQWTIRTSVPDMGDPLEAELAATDRPVLLVTAHRRESWGEPMAAIARAVARIAVAHSDHLVVCPLHKNPIVRATIAPVLETLPNVRLVEPLSYPSFCRVMNRSSVILTDSGGVQEEGPSLGKPVLVMRDTTERPEAVAAGTAVLVGTDEGLIFESVHRLITDAAEYQTMANAVNPYGDGQAARRSVLALAHFFGRGSRPEEFLDGAAPREAVIDLRQHVPEPMAESSV